MFDARPHTGPVVVSNVYTVSAKNEQAFIKAMARVRLSRLRTGASRWGLFRDGEPPSVRGAVRGGLLGRASQAARRQVDRVRPCV